jgi:hypothetical protein
LSIGSASSGAGIISARASAKPQKSARVVGFIVSR